MGSCAAPSAKGDDKFITTDYLQQCQVYRNPETGEVVETKGGNHRVLKAWKEQYGADTVNAWLQA